MSRQRHQDWDDALESRKHVVHARFTLAGWLGTRTRIYAAPPWLQLQFRLVWLSRCGRKQEPADSSTIPPSFCSCWQMKAEGGWQSSGLRCIQLAAPPYERPGRLGPRGAWHGDERRDTSIGHRRCKQRQRQHGLRLQLACNRIFSHPLHL